MTNTNGFVSYTKESYSPDEMIKRSAEYHQWLDQRRTVRIFSDRDVPKRVIDNLILSASTAPSGAHKQPWMFCAVQNPEIKSKIREAVEVEEKISYEKRMAERWLRDLEPLGTDWQKPYLEVAPWLIVVFKKPYEIIDGKKVNNYYVSESVGIATGMLLTAIHHVGLVALTHTPSPMNFLSKILNRPINEKPYLLIPVGYPAENTMVPDLKRKELNEICVYY
jgi:iodotyrosine deiodinase